MERIGKLNFSRLDLIGKGRYGWVFKGKYNKGMIDVAVKRVEKRESQVESLLLSKADSHPNIVRYFCTKENDVEFIYIATELCSGTLEDLVKGRYTGPSAGSRLEVLRQVLKGLAHLHVLDIVHGDLKPTNILISIPTGAVGPMMKLTDFGLRHSSKSFSPNGDQDLKFSVACTESWKAPESEVTFLSDMFSFGLVCGFSLSDGRHPYGEQDWERIGRIKSYAPILLTADQLKHVDSSAAAQVLELIKSLLSKEADQRPTAAQMLKHELFESESVSSTASVQSFAAGSKIKQEQPNEDDDIVILSEHISPKKSTVKSAVATDQVTKSLIDTTLPVKDSAACGSNLHGRESGSLEKGAKKRKMLEEAIPNKKKKPSACFVPPTIKKTLGTPAESDPSPGPSRLSGLKQPTTATATVKELSNSNTQSTSTHKKDHKAAQCSNTHLLKKKSSKQQTFPGCTNGTNNPAAGSEATGEQKTDANNSDSSVKIDKKDKQLPQADDLELGKPHTPNQTVEPSLLPSVHGRKNVNKKRSATVDSTPLVQQQKKSCAAKDVVTITLEDTGESDSTEMMKKAKKETSHAMKSSRKGHPTVTSKVCSSVDSESATSSKKNSSSNKAVVQRSSDGNRHGNRDRTTTKTESSSGNGHRVKEKTKKSPDSQAPSSQTSDSANDEDTDQVEGDDVKPRIQSDYFTCETCGKQYSSKRSLDKHVNTHTGAIPPTTKPHKCDKCKKTFSSPSKFSIHRQAHFPPTHECEYCHTKFKLLTSLKVHRDGNSHQRLSCKVRLEQLDMAKTE